MRSRSFVIHTKHGFKQAFKRTTPAVIAGVVVCSLLATAIQPFVAPKKASAQGSGLSIVDNQLHKDGKPYLPRGFNMIGLLTPDWCNRKEGIAARDNFGQAEMNAAKAWNANTLRFQLSQRGLADTTLTTDQRAAYLQRIQEGVSLARSNGFTVILSMQEQGYGCGNLNPLPTSQTIDAWSIVGEAFKTNPYVMFELYNEPNVENDAPGWEQWRNGGTTPLANNGFPAVGHQTLVEHLRGLGVPNVLIADGARKAARLSGLPLLNDPANQLMYGIHPYYYAPGETWWYEQYGYLVGAVPLIATEWNYLAANCGTTAEQIAPEFLQYLKNNNIGTLGHAFDTPGVTIADWTWTPTECGTATGGSGKVFKDFLATQADPDVDNPSAPASLTATSEAYNRVTLAWEASTATDVTSYQIIRDRAVIATVDANTLTYTDTTTTASSTYTYAVIVVDSSDNQSEASNEATLTTPEAPDTSAPTAIAALQATAPSHQQIDLSWVASSDNKAVAGYRIARDGLAIAEVTNTSFTDTTVTAETTYTYTVTAFDAAGNISEATTVSVTTPEAPDTTAPTAPSGLAATATSTSEVSLSWQASTDNKAVTRYTVQRNGVTIAETTETTYTDTNLTAETTYSYTVTAADAAGNQSTTSASATATTLTPLDSEAPTAPTNLKVYIASPTDIRLSWEASTDNKGVTGYRIARDGWNVATVTAPTYTDTRMSTGKTHTYKVYAQDAAGNESAAAGITVIVPAVASNGLTGTYFDTATFGTQKLSRVDNTVNFAWGTAAPVSTMGADTFSVRWTGKVIPVADETYTFYTQSDDGVRLWVNGQLLIDNWAAHSLTENSAAITLKANQAYDIKLEYYDNTNSATIKLLWSSPSVTKGIIPTDRLLAQ